jgi:DNA-binding NarL/FixJ family response regulator
LRNSLLPPAIATPSRNRPGSRLTLRQAQIVTLLQSGLSNREISDRLGISEGTVKVHLHRIYEKMGVSNRTQLAAEFMRSQRLTANWHRSSAGEALKNSGPDT